MNFRDDGTLQIADREPFLKGLCEKIGTDKRALLEALPVEELRYLCWRWDLWPRYSDARCGAWLLTWDSSAVERGRAALSEIEACGKMNWARARVLDVGCGEGGFLIAAVQRGAEAHGVDLQECNVLGCYLRAHSWQLPVAASLASATALPYASDSFDVVTCGDVIEHVADAHAALREIKRVLKPGGYFWLTAPGRFLPQHIWSDPHHHYFGVALMPPRMAVWYLVRLRRVLPSPDRFGVERLPTYRWTIATLRGLGFEILTGEYRPLVSLRGPAQIQTPWKRRLIGVLRRCGLGGMVTALFTVMAELRHLIRLVCRKPPQQEA